jgi:predicted DNA-binding transcriptional regulator YafY
MAETFDQPARLSPLMARALLLALDLLGDALTFKGTESLGSVRAKIGALVGEGPQQSAIIVDDVLPPETEIVEVLSRAIRDRQIVSIEYFTASRDELGERQVEPYLLFRSRDGWYLEAYCLKAGQQRTFRLERIRSARETAITFVPRPEIDLVPRRQGQAFSPDSRALWATVRFAPEWRTYLEDRGTGWEPAPDGFLVARIPYLDESWMAREIIRFLGDAVLERPDSARQRVRDSAASLLARYSRSTA